MKVFGLHVTLRWMEAIAQRPAAQKGVTIPHPLKLDTSAGQGTVVQTGQSMLQR